MPHTFINPLQRLPQMHIPFPIQRFLDLSIENSPVAIRCPEVDQRALFTLHDGSRGACLDEVRGVA